MAGKLRFLCCQHSYTEIAAAAAARGWTDVLVTAVPASGGDRPSSWGGMRPKAAEGCSQVIILACACLDGLGTPPADWPWVRLPSQGQPGHRRTASSLCNCLREMAARLVAEWRLAEERRQAREREQDRNRERADHKCAMDFLGRLPLLNDEEETVGAIEEMFHMLFAPQEFCYLRFEDGLPKLQKRLGHREVPPPSGLMRQIQSLHGDWAWTESQTGFILRITRAGEALGIIAVDHFAFPEYRNHYLSLARSIAGVAGLAIDNARTYRRMAETEEALRKSEHSLKMAQAMAHLGHWELDVDTKTIWWSDEAYRILGYDPQALVPTYDTFIQAIHPEDRDEVAEYFGTSHDGNRFDIDFRVVLPGGGVRFLHSMGEVVLLGTEARPKLLGTIQDITAYKELQSELEREARTDPLTGCANRRSFLELAARELARVRRHGGQLSLLMVDLDRFKGINDRHGHPVGDMALQKLVQVCQATLRDEDTIGRLGGEEFGILLPETGCAMAMEVAERLRLAVAQIALPLPGKLPLQFTASIGVATAGRDDATVGAILGRADRALYEAKSAGRNRAVAA